MELREMKVADVLMTEEYAKEMKMEMEWRQDLQTRAIGKFGMTGRTVLDRLREKGVYNPELMAKMYGLILQKRLDGFPRMERDYIEDTGRRAYVRTIEVLKRKEGEV